MGFNSIYGTLSTYVATYTVLTMLWLDFAVVYRSPSSTHENDDKLLDLIKDVNRLYSSNLLIAGL